MRSSAVFQVAQRAAQLQEALLHCGRFQDALESLLSWLIDTEDLVANQKPPSAEFKVVKAQIQEQKVNEMVSESPSTGPMRINSQSLAKYNIYSSVLYYTGVC